MVGCLIPFGQYEKQCAERPAELIDDAAKFRGEITPRFNRDTGFVFGAHRKRTDDVCQRSFRLRFFHCRATQRKQQALNVLPVGWQFASDACGNTSHDGIDIRAPYADQDRAPKFVPTCVRIQPNFVEGEDQRWPEH